MKPRLLIAAVATAATAVLAPAAGAQATAAAGHTGRPVLHPGASSGVRHAQGGHIVQRHGSRLSAQDEKWFTTAAAGDLFEIELGRIAQRRAVHHATRAYAARLVADHTTSYAQMKALGAKLHLRVPTRPTPDMIEEMRKVLAHHGHGFDVAYLRTEISDHRKDIADTRKEIAHGSNHRVVHQAVTELPVLRLHLRLGERALMAIRHR